MKRSTGNMAERQPEHRQKTEAREARRSERKNAEAGRISIRRFPRSLAARLVLSAMAVSFVLLVLAAVLLTYLFRVTVERNFDARLQAVLNGLLANVEVNEKGQPYLASRLADTRFNLPLSGWYWQIAPAEGEGPVLKSPSLLEKQFTLPPPRSSLRGKDGMARYTMRGPGGKTLRVIEQRYTLYGSRPYSFLVAGNYDELRGEITAFMRTMIVVFAVLALALALAIFIQVRYGLRPLKRLHDELWEIREGRRDYLTEDYPDEIRPVAHELNLLLKTNREIIERARTQVGNLAHALKTPLSVLINEAQTTEGRLARKVMEQVRLMRDQVNVYLDRARRAANASTLTARTPVCAVIEALVRTLKRIHRDSSLVVDVKCNPDFHFRGERQDLEEMIGNLLDNAFKYARHEIRITVHVEEQDRRVRRSRRWLWLIVEDDGPGLPEKDWQTALKRGRRLDETKPGSGLGLSIVSETAAMYGGEVHLANAELGGLAVKLRLPASG